MAHEANDAAACGALGGGDDVAVTVGHGLATGDLRPRLRLQNGLELLRAGVQQVVDQALYDAKDSGRNCVKRVTDEDGELSFDLEDEADAAGA